METLRQYYLLADVLITGGGMKTEEKGFNKSMLQIVVQWAVSGHSGVLVRDKGLSLRAGRNQLSADKPWRSFPFPLSGCGSPTRPSVRLMPFVHIGAHSIARDQSLKGHQPSEDHDAH